MGRGGRADKRHDRGAELHTGQGWEVRKVRVSMHVSTAPEGTAKFNARSSLRENLKAHTITAPS